MIWSYSPAKRCTSEAPTPLLAPVMSRTFFT
jgi:hypothetical protein